MMRAVDLLFSLSVLLLSLCCVLCVSAVCVRFVVVVVVSDCCGRREEKREEMRESPSLAGFIKLNGKMASSITFRRITTPPAFQQITSKKEIF